jgi:hypothetical protein
MRDNVRQRGGQRERKGGRKTGKGYFRAGNEGLRRSLYRIKAST